MDGDHIEEAGCVAISNSMTLCPSLYTFADEIAAPSLPSLSPLKSLLILILILIVSSPVENEVHDDFCKSVCVLLWQSIRVHPRDPRLTSPFPLRSPVEFFFG
jgi:hypothetical protein